MDNFDEAALIRELQKGSTAAFIHLYDRYHPALYIYIIRLIKLPDLAEDVLQDVFLKIWTIRERIDPDLSFQAYLYRISRNRVFKLLRKISNDDELRLRVMTELKNTVEDPEDKARWNQYEVLLKSAIDELPPRRREIFKLCREEGKTYKEVSVQLAISPNTVKEHMVLATKSIEAYFARQGENFFCIATTLFFLSGII